MDNQGSSTIEIAIILIIILMIFGVILSSIENSQNKVIKAEEINNIEKMTSEYMDNLIKVLKENKNTPYLVDFRKSLYDYYVANNYNYIWFYIT